MKKLIAVLCLTACGATWTPAAAQTSGPAMLAPGIYTTPEISARCQTYTNRRVSSSGVADTERQSVFLACVQRLYRDQNGSTAAAPVAAPIVEAPVALARYPSEYIPGCSTDEGYGRRGSCDTY